MIDREDRDVPQDHAEGHERQDLHELRYLARLLGDHTKTVFAVRIGMSVY